MRISATITKRMVRNNSLLERPILKRRTLPRATPEFRRVTTGATASSDCSISGSKSASTEDSQPSYDAPQPWTRQTGRKVVDRRTLADFRQCRIRHHDAGQRADVKPLCDCQSPGRNQFSGLRADNRCANYLTICLGYDFNVTVRFALGLRPVIVMIGP